MFLFDCTGTRLVIVLKNTFIFILCAYVIITRFQITVILKNFSVLVEMEWML